MYKFTGILKNEFYSEEGVNIVVKGLNGKIILAPMGPWHELDKEQEGNTLTFTLSPSSGNTELPRTVEAEVKNGSQKVTTQPTHWEVEITASSDSEPTELELVTFEEEPEYEEEGEAKPKE